MKNKLQNLTVIILVFSMLISITACGGKKVTSSPSDATSSNESSYNDTSSNEDVSSEPDVLEENSSSQQNNSSEDFNFNFDDSFFEEGPSNSSQQSTSSKQEPDEDNENEEIYGSADIVDVNDRPYVKYPAYLEYPMKSNYDKQANALRDTILSAKDKLPETVTGTIWYVSNKGKNTNSGKSPKEAWGSIFAMSYNRDRIKAGDAVLFERGGVYRGKFTARDGVYYGAYGEGEKPCIYGSSQNYAKVKWTYKNANIWVCDAPFSEDIGNIVFNHGEFMGFKKEKNYELENNGDFWCDSKNNYKLYMYMDENPAKKYKSIEISTNTHIIRINAGNKITIENLCLKYTGAHAIGCSTGSRNITFKNCEIGFIGGCYLNNGLRFGNGIEFWQECDNMLIENNWIYQIYDSGLTHQGGDSYIAKNIMMRNNLIEYCGLGSYEYWLSSEWNVCRGENITFTENICRFAGYCWGGVQRPDKVSTHIRADVNCRNTVFDFKITNNIFDQASSNLVEIGGTAKNVSNIPQSPVPFLSGNTYAQKVNGYLGTYFAKAGILFDEDRETFIKTYMGEKNAIIYAYN